MTEQKGNNIKWLLHTVAFLLVFLWLFLQATHLFRPIRNNIASFYSVPENSLDVIFIGGSSTFVYWEPYEAWNDHGMVSYNYSTSSMSPALLKNLITEAGRYQDPELYVIDLRAFDVREEHPDFYSVEYLRNITDAMEYSFNRIDAIEYAFGYEQPEDRFDPASYLDLMLYHSRWKNLTEDSFQREPVLLENKGFEFIQFAYHMPFEKNDYSWVTEVEPLSADTNAILIELLEYCKQEELNVLFFLNPFYMDSPVTKARYNYIQGLVEKYGYRFIDCNDYYDEMKMDFSTDFYNRDHVNILGAEKFTRFMGKYITTYYEIPDRRGDPDFADWEAGYGPWKERVLEQKERVQEAILENTAKEGE